MADTTTKNNAYSIGLSVNPGGGEYLQFHLSGTGTQPEDGTAAPLRWVMFTNASATSSFTVRFTADAAAGGVVVPPLSSTPVLHSRWYAVHLSHNGGGPEVIHVLGKFA